MPLFFYMIAPLGGLSGMKYYGGRTSREPVEKAQLHGAFERTMKAVQIYELPLSC